MRTFGVDVSHWEGVVDWHAAAAGIGFAYYKCTDGINFVDPQFSNNKQGCNSVGLAHAPYHYYQPSLDPIAQANHFIKTAGYFYKRYIVDLEKQENDPHITGNLQAFLLRVQSLTGIKPAIYTSAGYWNEFVNPKPSWAHEYDLLVAHYTAERSPILPIGWTTWCIWQFSDFWYFPGCLETSDGDWFNGTIDQCRAWFGNYRHVDLPGFTSTRVRSLFPDLHVRHMPSTISKAVDHLAKDEIVDLKDLGGKEVWIKHQRGWSCVEKDGYRYMEVIK
jgi:lysozyme